MNKEDGRDQSLFFSASMIFNSNNKTF